MMKKVYITPTLNMEKLEAAKLLAGSGVKAEGIGYGGIDSGGSLDPAAPQFIFDDF